jgi:hypothetical protein
MGDELTAGAADRPAADRPAAQSPTVSQCLHYRPIDLVTRHDGKCRLRVDASSAHFPCSNRFYCFCTGWPPSQTGEAASIHIGSQSKLK